MRDQKEIAYCQELLAAEVNNNKDWLKPDQSKMEEKQTRERPQSSLYHHYNENWQNK